MALSFRLARQTDFGGFVRAFFAHCPELTEILAYEWDLFLAHAPDLSMIVEDSEREAGDRIVGTAQTVFVSDAFIEFVRSGLPFDVNRCASNPLPDGSSPLLTANEIRKANSGDGLNALTTRWIWRGDVRNEGESAWTRGVRSYMDRTFPLFYRGYQYKYLLLSAYGEWSYASLLRAGFSLLTDYSIGHPTYNGTPEDRPSNVFLLCASRDEAGELEGSLVSRIFDYTPPRFHFKPHEQELLWSALLGYSDAESAGRLFVSAETIKKRWESIYDCVRSVEPDLIPQGGDGTRGAEKRRGLLAHLREHLQEVRPYCALGR